MLAFNNTGHSNSIREAQLVLKSDLFLILCKVLDGAGNTVSFEGIELTASGMLVTDSTLGKGLVYAADYSANFTVRSLVDKEYVDTNSVQSITGGTNINVAGTTTIPIVNLDAAITGTSVNGVTLTTAGSGGVNYLDDNGDYSVPPGVQSITGGTNINVSGTATVPVVNLDAAITGTSVNGVTLTTAGIATDFLNATGAYSAPATIFNTSGDATATRVISFPQQRMISFNCFDIDNFLNSNTEGFLQAEHDDVRIGRLTLDGAGAITGSSTIIINTSGMTIVDTVGSKGLVYASDYSASFTVRSLVDKEYVDTSTVQSITGGTNINVTGTATVPVVNLDAAITGTSVNGVTLTTGGSSTDFLNGTGAYTSPANIFNSSGILTSSREVQGLDSDSLTVTSYNAASIPSATSRGRFDVASSTMNFALDVLDTGTPTSSQSLIITSSGMLVTDSTNQKGLFYNADYSANFVDRSLIDKGYSDSGFLARSESGAANLTSSGKPILAVTDSSALRTVTIAIADIEEGRTFIVKDEGGLAGTNNITITTPTISVTSVASGTSGSDFITSAAHGYSIGQVIIHTSFADGDYNGKFTVTDIVNATRYEVAAITFVATGTGTSSVAIDGQASFLITGNYGSREFYCTDNQVFSKDGGGGTPLEERNSTTGILEGLVLSSVDADTLGITSGKGQIVNSDDPINPTITQMVFAGDSAYDIVSTVDDVYVMALDGDGVISEIELGNLTSADFHELVLFGSFVIAAGNIVRVLDEPVNLAYGGGVTAADLAEIIGPANVRGNAMSANGANLSLDNPGGTTFNVGENFRQDTNNPSHRILALDTLIGFRRSYRGPGGTFLLDAGGATFTTLDPSRWDDGSGTLQTVSANRWTVQVVYIAPNGLYTIAFGQFEYSNLDDAVTAVNDGTLVFEEVVAFQKQVLKTYVVMKIGSTSLLNLTDTAIIQASKYRPGGA